MLVANSFDLWQKDTFFSAAEEVQQSADIMESAYRTWLRARMEGLIPQQLDELSRELQMALGTAKWQLEEFERAVRLSYRNNADDITITRHSQFVSAIQDQISSVETALKESLNVEGKKPFRWVNLDEEECDDLALFLSGTPKTSQTIRDEGIRLSVSNSKEGCSSDSEVSPETQILNHRTSSVEVKSNDDIDCIIELRESKFPETGDEIGYQADQITGNRRAWSSPERAALEIVIDNVGRQMNGPIEATPKEKGFRPFFWRPPGDNFLGVRGVISHTQKKMIGWTNQHWRGHRSQRQQQVSHMFPVNPIRFVLVLMLTIFLVVPFVLYST
ncbi:hypothetical protein CDL12_13275 [Handroanthus impetiginosus]|uniref:Syntaxin 6/10/61 N-terminal domain-containing protein n=1 Tax=Handroanthus impetiginosus TaxID=429701 RepID=A0A2G9H9A4_9LAMI|nr:hypothetical protein CDL12_13276 [Handroanthus impetiginosus]PIN14102.1 hypothetical protein CDL12_13275 [Handroanthus impetiginosus]